jgi:hypothetical protein
MSVMAPQHLVPDPPRYARCVAHRKARIQASRPALKQECERAYRTLSAQVLDFLITSDWLTSEATDEGMGVTDREIRQRLDERKKSFPNGEHEFSEALAAVSQTVADVEFEARADLARQKIYQTLRHAAGYLAEPDVARYYREHIRSFHVPERRYFYILEFLKSKTVALRIMKEIARGKSLADMSLHESLVRTSPKVQGVKLPLYEAIFAARQGVLVGPVRIKHSYFIVEVTRIQPAALRSLAEVRGSIERKLSSERWRRTLAKFVKAWRKKWIAETDCRRGYVVQKCRQYNGPRQPEDPLKLK